jgi:UDP-GlcNAc:undecaprenyl-phosphate/decaprenyl-phosphate GlcNAc-1-phosphate transferase
MHALPFVLTLLLAGALAPPLVRTLRDGGHTRSNFRDRLLPFPFGVLVLAAAALALVPLMLLERLASAHLFYPQALPVAAYALGVLALGLLDDLLTPAATPAGGVLTAARGLRGHGAAALRGELTPGSLKAAGSLGIALLSMSYLGLSDGRWLLAAAVLVMATHVFNLLDLRPGRTLKAFALLGAGLAIGSAELRPLWAIGLFAAPALVAGVYDLRERVLLGDTGAGLMGALAGLWLVLTLSQTGQLIALAVLAGIALYGELRSISALVDRTPGLRELDSWGRPS